MWISDSWGPTTSERRSLFSGRSSSGCVQAQQETYCTRSKIIVTIGPTSLQSKMDKRRLKRKRSTEKNSTTTGSDSSDAVIRDDQFEENPAELVQSGDVKSKAAETGGRDVILKADRKLIARLLVIGQTPDENRKLDLSNMGENGSIEDIAGQDWSEEFEDD
ncbi:hypothetical protein ACROYT_G015381 [Oculina patagonica]